MAASTAASSALSTVGTAASIIGTGVSAIGAIQQSRANSAAAGYNAQLQANNAKISTQNASFAGAEGDANAGIQQQKTRAAVAATLANQGASGVDVNSESSSDVRASEAMLGQLNVAQIRSNAARQAYGFETQAANERSEGDLYKSEASAEETGGYLSAGATVLGGAGRAASKYATYLQNGGASVLSSY